MTLGLFSFNATRIGGFDVYAIGGFYVVRDRGLLRCYDRAIVHATDRGTPVGPRAPVRCAVRKLTAHSRFRARQAR